MLFIFRSNFFSSIFSVCPQFSYLCSPFLSQYSSLLFYPILFLPSHIYFHIFMSTPFCLYQYYQLEPNHPILSFYPHLIITSLEPMPSARFHFASPACSMDFQLAGGGSAPWTPGGYISIATILFIPDSQSTSIIYLHVYTFFFHLLIILLNINQLQY